MKLNKDQLVELSQIAIAAGREAGRMISEKAGTNISYEKKSTGASLASQVVTEVDRMSQDIVLKHLMPTCNQYQLGMLAEESEDDFSRFDRDYFWCVDPMDGTLPFIESRPGYAVSIGLVACSGEPIIGVVYDPLEHNLYHATKGIGAFRNEDKWDLVISSNGPIEHIDRGGAVMNACWVLEHGWGIFYKKPKKENGGGCLWDYAATACLFEVMGAWVSDMYGQPLELNRRDSTYMNHRGILFASHSDAAQERLIT